MGNILSWLRGGSLRWWLVGAALAALVGVSAFGHWPGTRGLPQAGLRVGFRDSPPFYYATQDRQPRGLAVDVMNRAAGRLGATLRWVQITEPSDVALVAGGIDVWATVVAAQPHPSIYVTEPWMETNHFLLFRRGDSIASARDSAGRRVSLLSGRFEDVMAPRVLPGALLVRVPSSQDKVSRVCDGSVDAAFADGREVQAALLDRPRGCERTAFDFVAIEGASWSYGIGVRPEYTRVADRLRAEIDAMAADGTLNAIESRWSLATAKELRLVYALRQARTRSAVSGIGIAALWAALLVALWHIRRAGRARRRAEEAAGREERYRLLFERNLAGVYRTTPDGRILDCNDAFAKMLGCQSREDLLAHEAWDFYPDRRTREAELDRLREHGSMTNYETVVRRRDGQTAVLLECATLIDPGHGQPAFLEGTILDITRLRELEDQNRQAQKLESIGLLAGGIAHDFNNALTAINGYADLLIDELDRSDPHREMVEQIAAAGRHAASLTRQLLAFSRRQMLEPKTLDLNRVIADVQTLIRRTLGETIELRTDLDPRLWPVKADPGQLQQVLINLAVNARDAMPDGGRFTLTTRNLDVLPDGMASTPGFPAGPCVRLSVADTGHGMDAQTRQRAFEPFFTTKPRGQGTGLGLSTVYGIVRQSGGETRLVSEPGRGTTFEVYLPRLEAAPADEANHAADGAAGGPAAAPPGRGSETILVVEDEADVRGLVVEVLARRGYRVLQAAGGDDAVAVCAAEKGPVHLLLSDVVMPGMSGPAVADALTQARPGLRVLFMSGYTDHELRNDAEAGGAGAFIQKPFTPAALAVKVRAVLDA